MKRRALALVTGLALFASLFSAQTRADVPYSSSTATISANGQCIAINPAVGQSTARLEVKGTFSATVTVSSTVGTVYSILTSTAGNATATAAGDYIYNLPTAKIVKACTTAYVSGSVTLTLAASAASGTSTSGAASSVTVTNFPSPGPTSSPGLAPVFTQIGPAAAGTVNGSNVQVCDVNGHCYTTVCSSVNTNCLQVVNIPGGVAIANASATGIFASVFQYSFNGSNWDPQIGCNKSAPINISSATTTAVVAVSGATTVYICSYDLYIVSGTNPGFQFEYGAGTACATSPTVLSGTYGGASTAVAQHFVAGTGFETVLRTPASQGFCIVTTGTLPNIQGYVNYTQF